MEIPQWMSATGQQEAIYTWANGLSKPDKDALATLLIEKYDAALVEADEPYDSLVADLRVFCELRGWDTASWKLPEGIIFKRKQP